tara:strand:+ start:11686 stop:13875 length:2190 start_codon:yes stop_codon:yes gene_type:complete
LKSITKYYPLILLISALAVRGIYFYQFQNNPFFDYLPDGFDQSVYFKGAEAFAKGDVLALAPEQNLFSPLYQYFLGVIFWLFGASFNIVWLAQFFLGTLSTLLIYFIGNHYFKPAVSFIAALLFTFYGVNWLYESTLYRAVFITFLELTSCYLLIRFANRQCISFMFLSAVFLSLVIQSRTSYLLILPFAFLYLWKKVFCQKNIGKKYFTGFLVIFILTSTPLLVWVKVVRGKWGLYDQTGAENLLISNRIDHDPRIYPPQEIYFEYTKNVPLKILPIIHYISETASKHPVRFLQVYLKKIYYYFNNYEPPNAFNFYLSQEFSPILKWGSIPYALYGSLGIIGFALLRKNRRDWTLLHAYFVANILIYLPFLILSRYRLSIVPFLSLFAAYTLWVVFQKIKNQQWFSLSVLCIGFILLNFIVKTNPLPNGKIRIVDYMNVGIAFLKNSNEKDDHYSYEYFKKAWDDYRRLNPVLPKPEMLLSLFSSYYAKEGEKYRQKNDLLKETESFKKALLYNYSSERIHYNYAVALYNSKKYKEAFLETLRSIVQNSTFDYSPHLLLGTIYYDSLQTPLWAYYHWEKAYELMSDSEKKKKLFLQIKNLQDKIMRQNPDFQSYSSNFSKNILSVLEKKTGPFFFFQPELTLPEMFLKWSSTDTEKYLISLYQHLILYPEKNAAIIYYQLGMLYWKKIEDEPVAYYYFKKSWDRGIKFQDFADVLNVMQERLETQDIL